MRKKGREGKGRCVRNGGEVKWREWKRRGQGRLDREKRRSERYRGERVSRKGRS